MGISRASCEDLLFPSKTRWETFLPVGRRACLVACDDVKAESTATFCGEGGSDYVTQSVVVALRTSLSGTSLQILPDLGTPLKGHSLSPRSFPPTLSAPSMFLLNVLRC